MDMRGVPNTRPAGLRSAAPAAGPAARADFFWNIRECSRPFRSITNGALR